MNKNIFKFITALLITALVILLQVNDTHAYQKRRNQQNTQYVVPQREIIVSPYINFIYAKDLYSDFIDDQTGFGGGLIVRTQAYENLGYFLDASYNNLDVYKDIEVGEKGTDAVIIFTGGLYYEYDRDFGSFNFDLGYGAITAGNNTMTIMVPGVEFHKRITDRISYNFKVGYLLTNDWIVDLDLEENYTSFSLLAGIAVLF